MQLNAILKEYKQTHEEMLEDLEILRKQRNYFSEERGVLINQLQESQDDDSLQHITWSEKENAQMGLTFTILGLIFMSNGKVSDDTLFKFLKILGVYEEEKQKKSGRIESSNDPIDPEVADLFDGDTKKFVNDILVARQHYLKRDRVQGPDPEVETVIIKISM